MTISAKIIADSISPEEIRLTTMQLRYPRFIHAEFMTHRVFSRNASSSRAVPVERLVQDVLDDPAIPLHWGKNQRGMQAREALRNDVTLLAPRDYDDWALAGDDLPLVRQGYYAPREDLTDQFVITDLKTMDQEMAWLMARDYAIHAAKAFARGGYHKQIVNRLLEPFSHINVVVTSTDWANFFALRDHPDAQPEIRELARVMKVAMEGAEPQVLTPGQWHLPYVDNDDHREIRAHFEKSWIEQTGDHPDHMPLCPEDEEWLALSRNVSAARCARVSYMTHEGRRPTIEEDLALYERLVTAELVHASPLEHQATPDELLPERATRWLRPHLHGNFRGWVQHRKLIPNEALPG